MSIVKKSILTLCLGTLGIAAGCGGSNSAGTGFGGGGTSGSFSNSSLSGNYAYQVTGIDLSNGVSFREAGVFVADGKGNITGGEDDFSEGVTVVNNTSSTGTYSVSDDGTGTVTLNFPNGGLQLAVAVQSSPTVYLGVNAAAEGGNSLTVNGTGVARQQTASAFTAAPSGNFVFRTHSQSSSTGAFSATVGAMTVGGGTITAGNEDSWSANTISQLTLTGGLASTPDQFGRGTFTLTDSTSATSTFNYYVVDSSHFYLFATLPGSIGLGQAEAQSGAGTFSASSLSGSYVFGSASDDSFSLNSVGLPGGVKTVGQFTASGGNITGGQFDAAVDGAVSNGTYNTSAYTVAANGRALVTLAPNGGRSSQQIFWMVSPSRAYFLTNDTTQVQDGTADLQTVTSFSTSTMNGQFGFANDGFLIPATGSIPLYDRAGYVHWDGSGNLAMKEFLNQSGTASTPGIISGSYTIDSTGRAVGNLSNLSSNLIFYCISGTQAYMLQADQGVEINGMMGALP
jgi:hypothetical protein